MTDWTIDKVAAEIEGWREPQFVGAWNAETPLHKAGLEWLVAELRGARAENEKAARDYAELLKDSRSKLQAAEAVVEAARAFQRFHDSRGLYLQKTLREYDKMKEAGDEQPQTQKSRRPG